MFAFLFIYFFPKSSCSIFLLKGHAFLFSTVFFSTKLLMLFIELSCFYKTKFLKKIISNTKKQEKNNTKYLASFSSFNFSFSFLLLVLTILFLSHVLVLSLLSLSFFILLCLFIQYPFYELLLLLFLLYLVN